MLSKYLFNLSTSIHPLLFVITNTSSAHSIIISVWTSGITSSMIYLHLLLPHSNPFLHGYGKTDLTLIPFDDTENTERGPVCFSLVLFLRGCGVLVVVQFMSLILDLLSFKYPWDVLEKKPGRRCLLGRYLLPPHLEALSTHLYADPCPETLTCVGCQDSMYPQHVLPCALPSSCVQAIRGT